MTEIPHVYVGFNHTAEALPKTDFVDYLQKKFKDKATTSAVLDAFEKMGQPAPEFSNEFKIGTEGVLVFLNQFGLVLRIEKESDFIASRVTPERINDSPWILKPIASIKVGNNAVFEICPGCFLEEDTKKTADLIDLLRKQNIDFWDVHFSNIGCIPVKTPRFPEGILVIIDRLAVTNLTKNITPVRLSLEEFEEAREAWEAQEELYGPLRQAFDAAWTDTQKMEQFFGLCRRYENEEKLVAGWNESRFFGGNKARQAKRAAAVYEDRRMKSAEKAVVNPAVAAVPQLLC